MDRPHIPDAPGLAWRARKNGWACLWVARQDIAKAGFKPSTSQLMVLAEAPTAEQETAIRAACVRLQEEMYEFGHERPKAFGGTVHALINAYQTDPDSRYQGMRYKTRLHTDALLKRIDAKYGPLKLSALGARDFKAWYEGIRWPDSKEGRSIARTAHAAMGAVRMMFSYGTIFEIDPQCARLKGILSGMQFESGSNGTEAMTLRQCEDIIAAAHATGWPSIALAQALQFDLRARQKDIVGEWVPVAEPGISVLPAHHGLKWLRGLRWEEISSTMEMTHAVSKSRTGKTMERDLKKYPMIMAELARIPEDKRRGPVVLCDTTGRPWKQNHFRLMWRKVATAAGIPATVCNMHSRAGGITETIDATNGNLEAARKEAGHSDPKMTARYSRKQRQSNDATAVIVADFRAKNRA